MENPPFVDVCLIELKIRIFHRYVSYVYWRVSPETVYHPQSDQSDSPSSHSGLRGHLSAHKQPTKKSPGGHHFNVITVSVVVSMISFFCVRPANWR